MPREKDGIIHSFWKYQVHYQESVSWRIRKVSFFVMVHIFISYNPFYHLPYGLGVTDPKMPIDPLSYKSIVNGKLPFYVLVTDYWFFYFYIKIACGFLFACMFVPTGSRRCQISLNWSYRWLLPNIMVLGIETRFLTREPSPAMIWFSLIGPRSIYLSRFPVNGLTHVLSLESKPL